MTIAFPLPGAARRDALRRDDLDTRLDRLESTTAEIGRRLDRLADSVDVIVDAVTRPTDADEVTR